MTDRPNNAGGINRRSFLKAGATAAAALPLFSISRWANAAEFNYKLATGQDPTHPVNPRAPEAPNRIREATGGSVDIKPFPDNQLGSDIREQIAKSCIIAVTRAGDNGFRHIASSTREIRKPVDLKGFKIRVPPAPMLTSLFKALEAGPAPINFNELYSALQTKVVEGQENPLAIIATAKLYEVQKSISLTGHVWDGYWILGNRRAWQKLPDDLRAIIEKEFDRSGAEQRADIAKLSASLRDDLKAKGLAVIDVDRQAFRGALAKTTFYADWKAKYGEQGWSLLEKYAGKLG